MEQRLRVGGVPEHFNLPWQQALESGLFANAGLTLDFAFYPTGTGALCADLRSGQLDLAVLLTEGAICDIVQSGGHRLLGAYVTTPLLWGVHVAAQAPFQTLSDLEGQTFAISREGSGSHLMALLLARYQHWTHFPPPFTAGGLEHLEQALCAGQAQAFLWEKYTTLPRVKLGTLRCIAEIPTPWPAFVLAASEACLHSHSQALRTLLTVLYQQTTTFMQAAEVSCQAVSTRFDLSLAEARAWFESVRWATDATLDPHMLAHVLTTLLQAGILTEPLPPVSELMARLA